MKRTMLKSKIHRATVTNANLNYEGSISIDEALMLSANIIQYEKVEIYNINNGERFSTYVIKGKKNTGNICINGAAARKVSIGDLIIICTYTDLTDFDQIMNKEYEPLVVKVNGNNKEV